VRARPGLLALVVAVTCVGSTSTWAASDELRRPMIASRHADWFPDGRTIAFESNLGHPKTAYYIGEGVGFDDPWLDVYSVRVDGSGLRNLTGEGSRMADIWPSVSPDGSRVAYLRGAGERFDLMVMAADGSRKKVLATGVWTGVWTYRPAWSPDGREIAFSVCCEEGRLYLYAVGADGGPRRRIVENAWWPTWSRDGSSIAYFGSLAGSPRLVVARNDGSGARILARATDGRSPSWSSASDRIVLNATGTGRFQSAVAVVSVAGGRASLVVDGLRRLGEPEWSPRDDRIAFSDDDLRTLDMRTGEVVTVAGGALLQIEPRWSPRGDLLVFGTEAERLDWPEVGAYLEVVRPDGTGRIQITPASLPARQTVMPVSKVVPPDRLSISSVRIAPSPVRPFGTLTARVVVESGRTGNLVDGAHLSVHAPPVALRVSPRHVRTRDGVVTMRIRLQSVPPERNLVSLVFIATKPGDPREEVRSTRFRAQVRIRR
jgi:Tol biopolymer transport system component